MFQDENGHWRFKCWGECNISGDAIDLICRLDKIDVKEGFRRYRKEAKNFPTLGINLNGWEKQVATDSPVPAVMGPGFDWFSCVQELGAQGDYICKLAKDRGYDVATLWHLISKELIGQYNGHLSFPVHSMDRNTVVGCHYLLPDKNFWLYTEGCTATPLILGQGPQYHATESTWDGIALVDRFGFEQVTVICTRGASNAKRIAGSVPAGAVVHLWPQNDKAGKQWLADAEKTLSKTGVCPTPEEFKDPNEWFLNL